MGVVGWCLARVVVWAPTAEKLKTCPEGLLARSPGELITQS